jgi:hypothetical protein
MMNENGGLSPEVLMAMANADLLNLAAVGERPLDISLESANSAAFDSASDSLDIESSSARSDSETIRALYQLKTHFDRLNALVTHENLLIEDHRLRALGIIQTIRTDLEAQRTTLDAATYEELATYLLAIEARVHARATAADTLDSQFAPAAFDPARKTTPPSYKSYKELTAPPLRPYPIHANNDCPTGTEPNTRQDGRGGEEEWCQQLSAFGGLRHGWYARYDEDGRPESMGHYENGLRVGVWTRFFPTGEVRAQAEFRDGMQHGWVLTFNKQGERTQSARYEDGAPVLTH